MDIDMENGLMEDGHRIKRGGIEVGRKMIDGWTRCVWMDKWRTSGG